MNLSEHEKLMEELRAEVRKEMEEAEARQERERLKEQIRREMEAEKTVSFGTPVPKDTPNRKPSDTWNPFFEDRPADDGIQTKTQMLPADRRFTPFDPDELRPLATPLMLMMQFFFIAGIACSLFSALFNFGIYFFDSHEEIFRLFFIGIRISADIVLPDFQHVLAFIGSAAWILLAVWCFRQMPSWFKALGWIALSVALFSVLTEYFSIKLSQVKWEDFYDFDLYDTFDEITEAYEAKFKSVRLLASTCSILSSVAAIAFATVALTKFRGNKNTEHCSAPIFLIIGAAFSIVIRVTILVFADDADRDTLKILCLAITVFILISVFMTYFFVRSISKIVNPERPFGLFFSYNIIATGLIVLVTLLLVTSNLKKYKNEFRNYDLSTVIQENQPAAEVPELKIT